jgi:hypothetical protein
VIIESPYAAPTPEGIARNVAYARLCVRDSLLRGEAPIASHLLYTQEGILKDGVPEDRALGIAAGLEWLGACDEQIFYVDLGWSPGMLKAKEAGADYFGEFGCGPTYKPTLRMLPVEVMQRFESDWGAVVLLNAVTMTESVIT